MPTSAKKILFIDRDGTLIAEPPATYQIDTLEQLEFLPFVLRNLYFITQKTDFELVMVTNQDGLGTDVYPQEHFDVVQSKLLQTLKNEGIEFDKIFIDVSTEDNPLPTRKPGTAMLTEFFTDEYDLKNSFVIGDRITDVKLAKNLGCRAIFLNSDENILIENGLNDVCALQTTDWNKISEFLFAGERKATVHRKTNETDVFVELNLDGSGKSNVSTGLRFFDHMLDQIGRHSGCDLTVKVKGDLEVDEHHTIEDTAIALGEAIYQALGSKRGIERYGFALPMDDCLCVIALDFGGRPWLVFNAEFKRDYVGDFPTEMFLHFFKSLSDAAKMNLTIKVAGDNEHHKIEAIFKAFAKAIKMAIKRDIFNYELPSTKGSL
ncbi:Histidine biosynthesis bifunctional protein HisB (Includes: Histidinol-phosphatase; Imidazoleglycerol-phosphate dehydratase) [uncultured Paludibacter sp.]|uniref:Histidine biosynthesis bifunctional protein HisB n=1 Tax=uncultured Paludibacter sp. TaxID=497635 RepID=A0A653A6R5_9BACT|nr:Histidine biosynthesis bifunctional protein HisB (Includes: Histidinol-phosphatase; Imidazoleglycerol-phosphate dehydratase) [uncultured Paludibacter sp.]